MMAEPVVPVLRGDMTVRWVLQDAGVDRASAVFLLTPDDTANLEAALLVHELNPAARIVMRINNSRIARRLDGVLQEVLGDTLRVVDPFEHAAPRFVAAVGPAYEAATFGAATTTSAGPQAEDDAVAPGRGDNNRLAGGLGKGRPGRAVEHAVSSEAAVYASAGRPVHWPPRTAAMAKHNGNTPGRPPARTPAGRADHRRRSLRSRRRTRPRRPAGLTRPATSRWRSPRPWRSTSRSASTAGWPSGCGCGR
jgi:hypothetical protein